MVVPPHPLSLTDKRALRAELRARRKAFVAGGPTPPAPPPLFLRALKPGAIVASYVPIGSEADPARFDAAVRQIAHPSGEIELAGLVPGGGSEAHALNTSAHGELSRVVHARISCSAL